MRRIVTFILIAIAMVLVITHTVHAAGARVVVKEVVTITVDRAAVRTDVPPINVNGVTLVPVRGVFNAFAAEIEWYPYEKRVFIQKDDQAIRLQIGDTNAMINDTIIPLAVAARIYRGRTMVPLRFIAEALGATVNWNPSTQTITIYTRERAILQPETTPPTTQEPSVTVPAPPATATPSEEPSVSPPEDEEP